MRRTFALLFGLAFLVAAPGVAGAAPIRTAEATAVTRLTAIFAHAGIRVLMNLPTQEFRARPGVQSGPISQIGPILMRDAPFCKGALDQSQRQTRTQSTRVVAGSWSLAPA